jgi:hypothetical protein
VGRSDASDPAPQGGKGLTRREAKAYILSLVQTKQGVKATELAAETALALMDHNVPELFQELVREGQMVEVEYVLPNLERRAKSFYLPKGTKVRLPI